MLFLICHYAGNRCALQAQHIAEILPLAQLRPLATANSNTTTPQKLSLRGILDYRGKPLKVYDLGLLNDTTVCRELISTRIIIVKYENHLAGLLAEEVYDMVDADASQISLDSETDNNWLRYNGELICILKPGILFGGTPDAAAC